MARPVRRSVGSDLSSPTPSTEHLNILPENTDPLRTTTEHTYTTTHAIPKFNRYRNNSSISSPPTISSSTTGTRGATSKPYPTIANNDYDSNDKYGIGNEYIEINQTAVAAERERVRMEFYATYDVMTGVRIAATLGGFFGLMVFLVIYKSRSKSSHPLKALKKNPNLAAQAAIVLQVEEQREFEEALQAQSGHFPDEFPRYLGYKRDRMMSVGNISAPPVLHRGSRFSSFAGYSTLLDPPRRYRADELIYESDKEADDEFDEDTTVDNLYHNYLNVPDMGRDSRRSSGFTCGSSDSSYLERRVSAITLGLPPLPSLSSRNASRRTSRDAACDNCPNIQVIQPTPKTSPCPSERNLCSEKTPIALAKNDRTNTKHYEPAGSFDYICECPDDIPDDVPYQNKNKTIKLDDSSAIIDTYSSNFPPGRAPLKSLESFKISSTDYQDSDLRSLGSDSVFAESYADTDEDMEQFSTDSDEISDHESPLKISLNLSNQPKSSNFNNSSSDATAINAYTMVAATNFENPNDGNTLGDNIDEEIVMIENDDRNLSKCSVNEFSKLKKLNSKSNSVSLLNTFETKAIIERHQQNDKQIRPSSYSGCCSTTINLDNNNDNYDNNNSDDTTKSSECVDIDIDIRIDCNNSTYKTTTNTVTATTTTITTTNTTRQTIASPSVILELPVLSTNQEHNSDTILDDDSSTIQLDPSIPGPSRKFSKETLF